MRANLGIVIAWVAFGAVVPRIGAQVTRQPLAVARVMAEHYPAAPSMSYIPALAWSGSYRLAAMTGEVHWSEKPRGEMARFLSGEQPAIGERPSLTALAGHLAFSDADDADAVASGIEMMRRAADLMLSESPDTIVRFATGWTDDMFMATSVLARVAERTREARYADAVGRLLVTYATRLQREDGLFIHAASGAHAWGRGNGFAALGMTEALMRLPESWSARPQVIDAYRRQMNALLSYQSGDGSWRQVVDQRTAYQELTVTALAITAMGRGIRFGWLDASRFLPVVERAWTAVLARVAEDGTLRDVCTSTGAQATLDYYMTRPVVNGADDRGGAMVLLAALEMEELVRAGVRGR